MVLCLIFSLPKTSVNPIYVIWFIKLLESFFNGSWAIQISWGLSLQSLYSVEEGDAPTCDMMEESLVYRHTVGGQGSAESQRDNPTGKRSQGEL